jgi:hypothetical protein
MEANPSTDLSGGRMSDHSLNIHDVMWSMGPPGISSQNLTTTLFWLNFLDSNSEDDTLVAN